MPKFIDPITVPAQNNGGGDFITIPDPPYYRVGATSGCNILCTGAKGIRWQTGVLPYSINGNNIDQTQFDSIYAPTQAGTKGQIPVAVGSSMAAPVWKTPTKTSLYFYTFYLTGRQSSQAGTMGVNCYFSVVYDETLLEQDATWISRYLSSIESFIPATGFFGNTSVPKYVCGIKPTSDDRYVINGYDSGGHFGELNIAASNVTLTSNHILLFSPITSIG